VTPAESTLRRAESAYAMTREKPMPRMYGMIDGMAKPARSVRNFHLPLPEPLYRRLRDTAARANQPATTVARYAIESWLRQQQKAVVREAIAAYAAKVAGTQDDLDTDLEAAALETWRPRKSRKRKP
jgi:hypothetical protein